MSEIASILPSSLHTLSLVFCIPLLDPDDLPEWEPDDFDGWDQAFFEGFPTHYPPLLASLKARCPSLAQLWIDVEVVLFWTQDAGVAPFVLHCNPTDDSMEEVVIERGPSRLCRKFCAEASSSSADTVQEMREERDMVMMCKTKCS
uniref:Uncharacterized protein n=1 Tax=Mycena chlorophos TaxID=658473 RepID=A0ABQ0L2F8_MYCCL|nr:predicted protein [Mycena chlorophos]